MAERVADGEKKSLWDNRFVRAAVVTLAVVFGIGVVVKSVS